MRHLACLPLLALGVSMWTPDPDVYAQPRGYNYDESKVPKYTLPDALAMNDGTKVTSADQWNKKRRGEVLKLFEEHMYGAVPEGQVEVVYQVAGGQLALGGKAIRKQVKIHVGDKGNERVIDLLIYLPAKAKGPVPVFLGLNFNGNHTVNKDPYIDLPKSWIGNNKKYGVTENRASESARGMSSGRWQIEKAIDSGYGVATIYCGDIDPDMNDPSNGIQSLFYKKGQDKPTAGEWGSIAAWAFGLSLAMDYFETFDAIDQKRVAVIGHSRLGKTALWAGASDPRFAIVISNNSGCGGAALNRRRFGETVKRINTSFPHWFCDNFQKYNDKEDELPLDQHMLVALCAPRPVLVNSATDDKWADPRGEFLSAKNADSVYRLLGTDGIAAKDWPEPNKLVKSTIGYHLRPGKHDVTERDWDVFIEFADHHWK
ncbi:MAG: acetylxylan esterase [Pirellulales bacterium]|nr:acetylxylan esterase [Pirellulales bacterium]